MTVQCSGGGRAATVAVLVDGARQWSQACSAGTATYTAAIGGLSAGTHRVAAVVTGAGGTRSAGSVSVTVR